MRKTYIILALVWLVVPIFPGVSTGPALGADHNFKALMGDNFGHIQKILIQLINSDYRDIPADVKVIEEHAAQLSKAIPPQAQTSQDLFRSLAFALGTQAGHLREIVTLLAEREIAVKPGDKLDINYLRNTAAAHFGQMVTACIACHNQFRRTIKR